MNSGLALAGTGAFLWGLINVLFSPCRFFGPPSLFFSPMWAARKPQFNQAKPGWYPCSFMGLFITIAGLDIVCSEMGWLK